MLKSINLIEKELSATGIQESESELNNDIATELVEDDEDNVESDFLDFDINERYIILYYINYEYI